MDMPELPEVETIIRSLTPKIQGLVVSSYKLLFPGVVGNNDEKSLKKLKGKNSGNEEPLKRRRIS